MYRTDFKRLQVLSDWLASTKGEMWVRAASVHVFEKDVNAKTSDREGGATSGGDALTREKAANANTSDSDGNTISAQPAREKTANAKTSHGEADAISGATPPRKRRGAPPGNTRALKTGCHTAAKRAQRTELIRLIGRINVTFALLGFDKRVKHRRAQPYKLTGFYPATKKRLAAKAAAKSAALAPPLSAKTRGGSDPIQRTGDA